MTQSGHHVLTSGCFCSHQVCAYFELSRGVHDYRCAWCTALVARGVGDVSGNEDLIPGARRNLSLRSSRAIDKFAG